MSGLDSGLRERPPHAESPQQTGRAGVPPPCDRVPVPEPGQTAGHSSGRRAVRAVYAGGENHQAEAGSDDQRGAEVGRSDGIAAGRQYGHGTLLHRQDKSKQTGRSENQLPDSGGHRKQRVRLPVHDLHERVFHRPEAERNAGRLCARQTAQSSAARLRHHRRTIPEAAPAGRISAVFAVGVFAGSTDALQTGAASTGEGGLQGGLLLPPRTHRYRLRLLGLSVHLLQV
uniref:(northern house mosquito) hypothetical protein n=1 Tax=Culex pipiens TaxID=7175 RepID=A0A8D8NS95_CULPI